MSTETQANSKRIAKNTMYLYFRMLFQLAVNLFLVRKTLQILGVVDYGIYNVVGGIVAMFFFVNSSMQTATTRFLNVELAKEDNKSRIVFSTALLIHLAISIIILILAETIGLWYFYNYLVVPDDRFYAATWVYQFSIISCMIQVVSVPYNAAIIAHERMGAFAYIAILETTLTALAVLLIYFTTFDKLEIYGLLILLIQLTIRITYGRYCNKNFEEVKGKLHFDRVQFKEMLNFASWILTGAVAMVGYTQGLNLLLNLFFGPAVNAARAVAVQVQSKISMFCYNFQTAVNPQITKNYTVGNFEYLHNLIFNSSKYSLLMVVLLAIPVIYECPYIMDLWLDEVPNYTVAFVRLTLCVAMIDALKNPLNTSIHATGDIKVFQIFEGGIALLILPIAYVCLKLGASPISVFITQLVIFILQHAIRLVIVTPKIGLSVKTYINKVIFDSIKIVVPVLFIPIVITNTMEQSFYRFVILCSSTWAFSLLLVYNWGIDSNTQKSIKIKIRSILKWEK